MRLPCREARPYMGGELPIFCHYDKRGEKNQEENEEGESNVKAQSSNLCQIQNLKKNYLSVELHLKFIYFIWH